jgi:hypothetical protein
MKIDNLKNIFRKYEFEPIEWADITNLDYTGIYILYDKVSDEVVYIGSALSKNHNLSKRINQHLRYDNSQGTLFNKKLKEIDETIKGIIKDMTEEMKKKLKEIESSIRGEIKNHGLFVVEYESLENQMIEAAQPQYNLWSTKKVKTKQKIPR